MLQVIKRSFSSLTMPLKFAANISMMFPEIENLLDRYKAAKQAGFEGVEVAFPYDFPVEKVVEAKEREQLQQVLLNMYPGAADPGKEDEFKKNLELSIKYCKALKCPKLHIMAGKVPDCKEEDRAKVVANMEDTFVENLKFAAGRLKQENILGLIEPINTKISIPGYFLDNQYKAVEIIKRIGSDNIKLQLDLFHLQVMHGNITNMMKELWPYVGHIQFAQCPNRHEPSFEGELNFDYIFSCIEKLGYDGWLGAEYKPSGPTKDTLKWMEMYK